MSSAADNCHIEPAVEDSCQQCYIDGLRVVVYGHCSDCEENLCQPCFIHHKKHKMSRNHRLHQIDEKAKTLDTDINNIETLNSNNSEEYHETLKAEEMLQDKCAEHIDQLTEVSQKSNENINTVISELYEIKSLLILRIESLTREVVKNIKTSQEKDKKQLEIVKSKLYNTIEFLQAPWRDIRDLNDIWKDSELFVKLEPDSDRVADFDCQIETLVEACKLNEYKFNVSTPVRSLLENDKALGTIDTKPLLAVDDAGAAKSTVVLEGTNSIETTMVSVVEENGNREIPLSMPEQSEIGIEKSQVSVKAEVDKSAKTTATAAKYAMENLDVDLNDSVHTIVAEFDVSLRADELEIEKLFGDIDDKPNVSQTSKCIDTLKPTTSKEYDSRSTANKPRKENYPRSGKNAKENVIRAPTGINEKSKGKTNMSSNGDDSGDARLIKNRTYTTYEDIYVGYPKFPKLSCWIRGMTLLRSDCLVVCDWKNSCITMFDTTTSRMIDWIEPFRASDVTKICYSEFAVTLTEEGQVQFVSVEYNKLKLGQTIYVGSDCLGLNYHKELLVVTFANPGRVEVFNKTGTLMRSVRHLNGPCHVVSTDRFIYISDQALGAVVKLDWRGECVASYHDLTSPCGIVISYDDTLFVCDQATSEVLEISSDCSQGKVIIDKLWGPSALYWCSDQERLYCSSYIGKIEHDNYLMNFKVT